MRGPGPGSGPGAGQAMSMNDAAMNVSTMNDIDPVPAISVVVPVRDNWALTRECLTSLRNAVSGDGFEVIVVDDGSGDATIRELEPLGRSLFGARFGLERCGADSERCGADSERRGGGLERRGGGLGFARAVNLGARRARGRWLFLLNNDTLVPADPFPALLALLQSDPILAGVGPLLLYPDQDRVQHLGVAVAHSLKCVHLYHLYPADHPVVRRWRRFQVITAAALLVERELFLARGGFYNGYVNGMEDIDFCAGLAREGRRFAVAPDAVVRHHAGRSAGRFDRERDNTRLLTSRVQGALVPDMARLAAEDGYALGLTPWLDPYLVPDAERIRALDTAGAATDDPAELTALLDMEPCWAKGYDMLAAHLARSGNLVGAVAARVRQTAFLPTPEALSALEQAAKQAGDRDRLRQLRSHLTGIKAVLDHKDGLTAQARQELARAWDNGDQPLVLALTAWLDAYGAEEAAP